jgi:hypothetical protein
MSSEELLKQRVQELGDDPSSSGAHDVIDVPSRSLGELSNRHLPQQALREIFSAADRPDRPEAGALRHYMRDRGLAGAERLCPHLRCHPNLAYFETGACGERQLVGVFPVMLAPLVSPEGELVGLNATYLTEEGGTAPVRRPERTWIAEEASGNFVSRGAAVRLCAPGRALAIAGNVQDGMAVALATGLPVWVGATALLLEAMRLPRWIREVTHWAVRDAPSVLPDGASRRPQLLSGQRLVRRLQREGRCAQLFVAPPSDASTGSWYEVYREEGGQAFPRPSPAQVALPTAHRLRRDPQ